MQQPRSEHPRPQFQRENWRCLNGRWSFEIDNSRSGQARGLSRTDACLSGEILVPFCPESRLSGLAHTDFILGAWYQRTVSLSRTECAGRVLLHFGAVDYACTVYVNGTLAGDHQGGYTSFSFDISSLVREGENVLTVYVEDDSRSGRIPSGKQSGEYGSYGCFYTRTTGIWQSVWLEFVPEAYIQSIRLDTDIHKPAVYVTAELAGCGDLYIRALYQGEPVGEAHRAGVAGQVTVCIPLEQRHLWEPGHGRLYDLELTFGEDCVRSYFGLRSVRLDGMRFCVNDRSLFLRLVLDQGFYPDGIYTAPTDQALVQDIDLAMAMGFNGARLHEKIFEERFLYHCDQKGYLVWGEYPNWGLDHTDPLALYSILPEWLEALQRDRNHPAIVGWCPFNETWDVDRRKQYDDVLRMIYRVTKAVDPSRPCIDTSGNYHVETDIFDLHDYDQNPETFRAHYDALFLEGKLYDHTDHQDGPPRQTYEGQPVFLSEYGGIRWSEDPSGWGYGNAPKSEEEFRLRFQGLADAQLDNPLLCGLCYTQLTDVEQEQNGLYTYDRRPKHDPDWIRTVLTRQAAIEKA